MTVEHKKGQGLVTGSWSCHATAETEASVEALEGFGLAVQVQLAQHPRGPKALLVSLRYF